MTTSTTTLVQQLREALRQIDTADQWLAAEQDHPRCQAAHVCDCQEAGQPCARKVSLADPMDWPLPCDVKVGHGTHARGTKLRSLVARMQALYDTVQASQAVAQPLTDEQTRADAARWREMRRVFHVTEHIGKTTGMPATKLSCHWHGWASGDHADVTGCVDALIYERAHGIGQPAEDTK